MPLGNIKQNIGWLAMLIMIIMGVLFFMPNNHEELAAKEMKLSEVTIALVPETSQILFLNRKTLQLELILSKDLSLAIFAMKEIQLQSKYNSQLENKLPIIETTKKGGK